MMALYGMGIQSWQMESLLSWPHSGTGGQEKNRGVCLPYVVRGPEKIQSFPSELSSPWRLCHQLPVGGITQRPLVLFAPRPRDGRFTDCDV